MNEKEILQMQIIQLNLQLSAIAQIQIDLEEKKRAIAESITRLNGTDA